ncbi:unnamed protein product, partial [Rotaria magnacalcarata]
FLNSIDIHPNARWKQNGITVAGGNEQGNGINQLSNPLGLYVDDDQTVYVADQYNHRIVEWKSGATSGQVVAGGNGQRSGDHQLSQPLDVIVDKETNSLIISDNSNKRVVRWPRRNGTSGETIISNINCVGKKEGIIVAGGQGQGNGLTQLSYPRGVVVDQLGTVYVADFGNTRIMRWPKGATQGSVIVGGHGGGGQSNQLNGPIGLSFDRHGNLY